jgi:mono/diheme cytochrome c family protein
MRRLAAVLVVLVLIVAIPVFILVQHGISARSEPTAMEVLLARSLRHLAVPRAMRDARNPIPLTPQALNEGREHFADHCAGCHANDGSGNTEIGKNLYPKAPDMRQAATQNLSDGELFAIIRNGVRLTGMPAWGDPGGRDDADTWKLVHFIRHIPKMTPAEIEQMKAMNPVPAEQKQEENFLEGK